MKQKKRIRKFLRINQAANNFSDEQIDFLFSHVVVSYARLSPRGVEGNKKKQKKRSNKRLLHNKSSVCVEGHWAHAMPNATKLSSIFISILNDNIISHFLRLRVGLFAHTLKRRSWKAFQWVWRNLQYSCLSPNVVIVLWNLVERWRKISPQRFMSPHSEKTTFLSSSRFFLPARPNQTQGRQTFRHQCQSLAVLSCYYSIEHRKLYSFFISRGWKEWSKLKCFNLNKFSTASEWEMGRENWMTR